jgi:hypothetical protein
MEAPVPLAAKLTSWHPYLLLAVLTLVFIVAAWLGVGLRHRFLSQQTMEANKEVIGAIFNNTAILYTVLLAFMVIGVWEEYNKALAVAEQEPACLIAVAQLAETFPQASPGAQAVRKALTTYCQDVVDKEYPAVAQMAQSRETEQAADDLWAAVCALQPGTAREINAQNMLMYQMGEMQKARTSRLLATSRGLPGILWMVIICFTALTLGFSLLLSTEASWPQRLTVGGFAVAVALVLFAIVELNYPFIGEVSVNAEGFQTVLNILK